MEKVSQVFNRATASDVETFQVAADNSYIDKFNDEEICIAGNLVKIISEPFDLTFKPDGPRRPHVTRNFVKVEYNNKQYTVINLFKK